MKKSLIIVVFLVLLGVVSFLLFSAENIRIISPNGGEKLKAEQMCKISWVGMDLKGKVRIILMKGQKEIKTIHSFEASYKGSKTDSYMWKIPKDITGEDFTLRIIYEMDKGPIFDDSDRAFSIGSTIMEKELPEFPKVEVNSPNGGEQVLKGSELTIRWESNVEFATANIEINRDGYGNVETLHVTGTAMSPNSWYYRYIIPRSYENGDNYRIRIHGYRGRVADQSDRTFSVVPGVITINSPRDGDVWYRADNQMIRFSVRGTIHDNLRIYVAEFGGSYIARSLPPDSREHMWRNVGVAGGMWMPTGGRIVVETVDGLIRGINRGRGYILRDPTIDVTSPGGTVNIGRPMNVRWTSAHLGGNVNIVLYRAPRAGGAFERVEPPLVGDTANDGSHSCSPPTLDRRYKIRVESVRQSSIHGEGPEFTLILR